MLVFPSSTSYTIILGTSLGLPIPVIQMSVLCWLTRMYTTNFSQISEHSPRLLDCVYDDNNDDNNQDFDDCEKLHLVLLGEKGQLIQTDVSELEIIPSKSDVFRSSPESCHSGDTTLVAEPQIEIKNVKPQAVLNFEHQFEPIIHEIQVNVDLPEDENKSVFEEMNSATPSENVSEVQLVIDAPVTPINSKVSVPVESSPASEKAIVSHGHHHHLHLMPKLTRKKSMKKLNALKDAIKLSVKFTKSSSKKLTTPEQNEGHKLHLFKKLHSK